MCYSLIGRIKKRKGQKKKKKEYGGHDMEGRDYATMYQICYYACDLFFFTHYAFISLFLLKFIFTLAFRVSIIKVYYLFENFEFINI